MPETVAVTLTKKELETIVDCILACDEHTRDNPHRDLEAVALAERLQVWIKAFSKPD